MNPLISVLLPTVRPTHVRRSLDSVKEAAGSVPYEVVVVADFGPEALACHQPYAHLKCRWIECPRRGPIDAIEAAYQASQGTYVFVLNDESTLDPGALETLYAEAIKRPRVVYSPKHVPDFTFTYYGKPFAAFPFVHRDLVRMLGGLFDPAYRGFYADPDFSMRAHAMGVPIQIVESAVLRHSNSLQAPGHQENVTNYLAADRALFRSRWDHLGSFQDPA